MENLEIGPKPLTLELVKHIEEELRGLVVVDDPEILHFGLFRAVSPNATDLIKGQIRLTKRCGLPVNGGAIFWSRELLGLPRKVEDYQIIINKEGSPLVEVVGKKGRERILGIEAKDIRRVNITTTAFGEINKSFNLLPTGQRILKLDISTAILWEEGTEVVNDWVVVKETGELLLKNY